MDILNNFFTGVFNSATSSARRFTTLIAIVIIGMLIGSRIDGASAFIPAAIIISILLAIVAFVNTDATILFLIGIMLLLLL
ncbi:MAG: hypothetical protein WC408_03195 [Candidatus Micrarchaeia archaeon]